MKLYLVKCKGMTSSFGSETAHGIAYVVAKNCSDAYESLRKHLDKENLGFSHERELDTVQLIADEANYPQCGIKLLTLSKES